MHGEWIMEICLFFRTTDSVRQFRCIILREDLHVREGEIDSVETPCGCCFCTSGEIGAESCTMVVPHHFYFRSISDGSVLRSGIVHLSVAEQGN